MRQEPDARKHPDVDFVFSLHSPHPRWLPSAYPLALARAERDSPAPRVCPGVAEEKCGTPLAGNYANALDTRRRSRQATGYGLGERPRAPWSSRQSRRTGNEV